VLGHALGVPGLPVDRHVLRVANRLGLAHSRRSREGGARARRELFPKKKWTLASDTLILHGRRICKPTPQCKLCFARPHCDYAHR
jgi:endonuclease III